MLPANRSREGSTDGYSRRVAEHLRLREIAHDFFTRCFPLFSPARANRPEPKIDPFVSAVIGSVLDFAYDEFLSEPRAYYRSVYPISLTRHFYVAMRVPHLARVFFTRGCPVSYASMCVLRVCVSAMSVCMCRSSYCIRMYTCVHINRVCGPRLRCLFATTLSRLLLFFLFLFLV